MMFSKALGLFATFATLASALPAGNAGTLQRRQGSNGGGFQVINNLNSTIYAWQVSDVSGEMQTLQGGGGSFSSSWQNNPDGGGISVKLSTTQSQADILQFEYTAWGETIFWDLSCINMGSNSEFTSHGFSVTSNSPSCPNATCAAGDLACSAAYLTPNDNFATHGCPIGTFLTVNIGQ